MIKHAALVAALTGSLALAPPAQAVEPGCQQDAFLYGMRWATRLICDDPIQADGSWTRHRGFFAPARYRTSCYTYSCDTYQIPELRVIDHYTVTPDIVLPDEPGHIPGG